MPPSRRIRPWRLRLWERVWVLVYRWLGPGAALALAEKQMEREADRWRERWVRERADWWSEVKL